MVALARAIAWGILNEALGVQERRTGTCRYLPLRPARNIKVPAGEIDHEHSALADFGQTPGRLCCDPLKRAVFLRLLRKGRELQGKIVIGDAYILVVVHERKIADGVTGRKAQLLIGEVQEPSRIGGRPLRQHMLHRCPGGIGARFGQAMHPIRAIS